MRSARAAALLVAVALLAGGVVASSAFTTATVDRDAGIDVVSDDTAVIALDAGPQSATGGVVSMSSGGELTIDFAVGTSQGVNPNAVYTLGDSTSPDTEYAFSITNLDAQTHDITVDYTGVTDPDSSNVNVEFAVYDENSPGSTDAVVSEQSGTQTLSSVTQGNTHYVVMTVDTTGVDNSSDLSGTLEVSI